MTIFKQIIILTLVHTYQCATPINNLFNTINEDTLKFNKISAEIAWEYSVNPGHTELIAKAAKYQKDRIIWQQPICDTLATLLHNHLLNSTQERQTYLLCRGPKFTFEEARETSNLYKQLQDMYNAEICVPNVQNMPIKDVKDKELAIVEYISTFSKTQNEKLSLNYQLTTYQKILLAVQLAANKKRSDSDVCLKGEIDFDQIMVSSKKEEVLKWTWLVWREKTALLMKEPYRKLADIENVAARSNGYQNIGASWRDELEIPDLRALCKRLFESIQPLYTLLHGVVRFHLRRSYGDVVPEMGPIPAHLLGNLWSQNWEHLSDLLIEEDINLDNNMKKLNWTVTHMVKRAEDYYQSLGLPAMTDAFWRESEFVRDNNAAKCHGAAADMFKDNDFRLLYCSETTKDDFYVIHHELGHIQYYMAYKNQPALFRQANSALQETIGDTVMYGVMTPQHLHRLGLITDSQLYSTNTNTLDNDSKENKNEFNLNTKFKRRNSNSNLDYKKNLNSIINQLYERSGEAGLKNNKPRRTTNNYNLERDLKISELNNIFKNKNLFTLDTKINKRYDHPESINYHYNPNSHRTSKFVMNKRLESSKRNSDIKMKLNIDEALILKQALNKIPQIPFALLIDEYRWEYFEGSLKHPNDDFWKLSLELQGISPPNARGEEYFDAGAKFHVPDNTPYIRYFLSSFLQHQLFESLCKTAVFGRRDAMELLPETISLNRCDLYGSKAVGKVLKDIMARGHSQHWKEILKSTVNISEISSTALQRYYRPLQRLLLEHVRKHNIPIGW